MIVVVLAIKFIFCIADIMWYCLLLCLIVV